MRVRYQYTLDGHTPVPCADLLAWARWFETADRVVEQTQIGDVQVSTVFLGLDHNWTNQGLPLLFETMVFGRPDGEEQERYPTWDEALHGHRLIVERLERERHMAAGPIPRRVVNENGLQNLNTEVFYNNLQNNSNYGLVGDGITDESMGLQNAYNHFGFGYGATFMAPIQLRDGDQWVRPSAGIEFSESVSGSAEAGPEHPQQDQAELRRIRAEAIARQTEAETRARALLVEVIGEPAVQTLEAGGTYAVPSRRWPGTEYHIPKMGYIKIVRGGLWQEVCLVSSDHALPWADIVLSRIKMIEANETIVQGKGNKQGSSPNPTLARIRQALETVLNPRRDR